MPEKILLHGSCVAIEGAALLLRGPPGAGKSDLALRLMEAGGTLVADDQTLVTRRAGDLYASSPATIAGKIEVRGIGILAVDFVSDAPLMLLVDLVEDVPERLPEPAFEEILGVQRPLVRLRPFEACAVAKLKIAVRTLSSQGKFPALE